jgi:hypothetical protein
MALFQAGILPIAGAIKGAMVKNTKHKKTAPAAKSETVESKFNFPTYG